jgi:hypothetical protein
MMVVNYLSNKVIVDNKTNTIKVPSLLNWFETEFYDENAKDSLSVLKNLINKYQINTLSSLLSTLDQQKIVVEILPFDFTFCCDLNFVESELDL